MLLLWAVTVQYLYKTPFLHYKLNSIFTRKRSQQITNTELFNMNIINFIEMIKSCVKN